MGLRADLDKAQSRIADLEMMLETLQGHSAGSRLYWEAWDFHGAEAHHAKRINLPDSGRFFIELGKDRHGRTMRLELKPSNGPDGTRGVEIRGEHMLRTMSNVSNCTYITEMDTRDIEG